MGERGGAEWTCGVERIPEYLSKRNILGQHKVCLPAQDTYGPRKGKKLERKKSFSVFPNLPVGWAPGGERRAASFSWPSHLGVSKIRTCLRHFIIAAALPSLAYKEIQFELCS